MYDAAAQAAIPLARRLKEKYGDAEAICIARNISVELTPLAPGVHGLHLYRSRIHVILLEPERDPYALRFTLGHELGHYFLDNAKNRTYIDYHRYHTATIERRADIFSAALILPERLPVELDYYNNEQLSAYYGVPSWTLPIIYPSDHYFF